MEKKCYISLIPLLYVLDITYIHVCIWALHTSDQFHFPQEMRYSIASKVFAIKQNGGLFFQKAKIKKKSNLFIVYVF